MESRSRSKNPSSGQRRPADVERAQRAALALRRKAVQDRESFRQLQEFLHGSLGARA